MKIAPVLIAAIVLLAAAPARSKEKKPLQLSKTSFREVVTFKSNFHLKNFKPGVNEFSAVLTNRSDAEVKIRLKASDVGAKYENYRFNPSNVILPEEFISIQPGKSIEVKYKVKVGKDQSGAKAFRLGYRLKMGKVGPSVAITTTSMVMFNIEGTGDHSYAIKNKVSVKFGRLALETKIKNTGDLIIYGAKLSYVVLNRKREKIMDSSHSEDFFLLGKGSESAVKSSFGAGLPPGKYTLMTILTSPRDKRVRSLATESFEVK